MADQVITKQELIDAQKDAQTLEDAVNGEPGKLIKSRTGREFYSLASVPQINTMTREEISTTVAPKADKIYVDQLVINANNNITNYQTQAALLAFIPTTANYTAKALDTKKVWLWDGVQWNDTGLSELDLAKEFSNSNPLFKAKALTSSDNLNNVIASGLYLSNIAANATTENNYPITSSSGFGILQVYHLLTRSTGTLAVQVFHGINNRGIFTRSSNAVGDAWLPWQQVLTNTVLDSNTLVKTVADGVDLNTLVTRGDYSITRAKASTYLNLPPQINDYYSIKEGGTLTVIVSKEASVVHQYFNAYGDFGTYFRSCISTGVWTPWYRVGNKTRPYTNKDLNSLLESGSFICNTTDYPNHNYPAQDQLLVNIFSYSNVYRQVAYQRANNTIWTRSHWGSNGWQPWVKLSNQSDIDTVNQKIEDLDLRKVDETSNQLKSLYDDLHNPLMSVNIKLIGDSITWGTGAGNTTTSDPRNGTLTDVRNTTDPISPSWANLLRRFLCSAYTDGTLVHSGGGVAYSENENIILLSREVRRFTFKNTTFNKTLSNSEVVQKVAVNTAAESKEYLDIVNVQSSDSTLPTELSFSMNGSGFKVEHAVFANGTVETYYASVYVDGVFLQKINLNGAAAAHTSTYITLPNNGKHTILIKNDGQQNNQLRITAIKSIKRISIANDGINGSSSRSWLSSVTLASSITRKDDYVFVQLGTNDRITSVNNTYGSLAKNLKQIVSDIYALSSNNAKVILIGANAVTQDENPSTSSYFMNMRTINNIVYSVAKEKNVSFISNFEATEQLKIDGTSYLADGLHPNDLGHRTIFENIKNRILIK